MLTLIKNGNVIFPEYEEPNGRYDILIAFDKFLKIEPNIESANLPGQVNIIDATGYYIVPGFIDQHVHITGGGGEDGPSSRTPEINLSQITKAGITTVVGLLGVDGITRSVMDLLAKARGLEKEGVSTYIFSGAYEIPTRTLTGNLRGDLVLIDKVIGSGEIAISDHRSAQPTFEMLAKLGAEARVGGMLGGKAGIVHVHVGEGKQGLELLFEISEKTDLPFTQFIPTHVNRLNKLFYQAVNYVKRGGYIDLTAGINPKVDGPDALNVPQAVKLLLEADIPLSQVSVSSDGNGSLPQFDPDGNLISIKVGSVDVLWADIKQVIEQEILSLDKAVSLITSNVARQLKLDHKGKIAVGADADLVIIDKELNIDTVIARGKVMIQEGVPVVKGTFE